MTSSKPLVTGTAHVLPFERLSPADFERLCLWLVEREGYIRAEHLGLAGSEQGRDVIAHKPTPQGEQLWYFQCKRYQSLNAKILKGEVDKYLKLAQSSSGPQPYGVVFVASCAISADTREKVSAYCGQHNLACEFWALTELDARVKRHPDLLREFFHLYTHPIGVSFQAPTVPPYFVSRPEVSNALKRLLLAEGPVAPGALTIIAVQGAGGIGKTTLVTALAHDPDIQTRFADGVLWVTLGQRPDVLPLLVGWIQALGDRDFHPTIIESASAHLRTLLHDKACLLVVDDVWQAEHARPFLGGGERCRMLLTTRDAQLALALGARIHHVEELSQEQAVTLLRKLAGTVADESQIAGHLAELVGRLPLALELLGSLAAWYADNKPGWDLDDLCQRVKGDPRLFSTFRLSYDVLSVDQQLLFRALGAFSSIAPLAVVHLAAALRQEAEKVEQDLDTMVFLSLVRWERKGRLCALHPLLHDFARHLTPENEQRAFHLRLVNNVAQFLKDSANGYEQTMIASECMLALDWDNLPSEIRMPVLKALRELMCDRRIPEMERQSAAFMLARMSWLTCVDVESISPDEMLTYLGVLAPYIGIPADLRTLEQMISGVLAKPAALTDGEQAQLLIYRAGMRGQIGRVQRNPLLLNAAEQDYQDAKGLLRLAESTGRPVDCRMLVRVRLGLANIALARSEITTRGARLQQQAVKLLKAAAKLAQSCAQDILVTVYGQLCYAYTLRKKWDCAEQAYKSARKALDDLDATHKITEPLYKSSLAWLLGTASNMYLQHGEELPAEEALAQYKEAYRLVEQQIDALSTGLDEIDLAFAHITAGDCQRAMVRCQPRQAARLRRNAQNHWQKAQKIASRVDKDLVGVLVEQSLFKCT